LDFRADHVGLTDRSGNRHGRRTRHHQERHRPAAPSGDRGVWNSLDLANRAALWLANTNIIPDDAFLTNLTYTQAEVTLMRAAINDLGSSNGLWGVAHNLKTVTSTNNFFFNSQS
jgi:hypothetical protein